MRKVKILRGKLFLEFSSQINRLINCIFFSTKESNSKKRDLESTNSTSTTTTNTTTNTTTTTNATDTNVSSDQTITQPPQKKTRTKTT